MNQWVMRSFFKKRLTFFEKVFLKPAAVRKQCARGGLPGDVRRKLLSACVDGEKSTGIMMKKLMLLVVAVGFMTGCGDCSFWCKKEKTRANESSCCSCDSHQKVAVAAGESAVASDEVVASEAVAARAAAENAA